MSAKKKVTEEVAETNPVDERFAGKTVQELRDLHANALVDESDAKRTLVLLRQRAVNLPSTAGPEVEHEIIQAKAEWADSVAWLKAVEAQLENEYLDIYGTKK